MPTDPLDNKPEDTKAILERLQEGLQKFAAKFAEDLNDPRLKKRSGASNLLMFQLQAASRPFTAILIPRTSPGEHSEEDKLTPREEEVEIELVKGLTYKAIGKRLHMELGTVASHVRNLYDKRHVHSRAALMRQFLGLMS